MSGSGDLRFILITPEGYMKTDGSFTNDPNEAFHGNIYHIGGRFCSIPVKSFCKTLDYKGDPKNCKIGSFTNWISQSAKENLDIYGSHELGYSDRTYLKITDSDLCISENNDKDE